MATKQHSIRTRTSPIHMSTTITLVDTFNRVTLSRHRTVEAAVRAMERHARAVRRANGPTSYLTYSIRSSDGRDLREDVERAQFGS